MVAVKHKKVSILMAKPIPLILNQHVASMTTAIHRQYLTNRLVTALSTTICSMNVPRSLFNLPDSLLCRSGLQIHARLYQRCSTPWSLILGRKPKPQQKIPRQRMRKICAVEAALCSKHVSLDVDAYHPAKFVVTMVLHILHHPAVLLSNRAHCLVPYPLKSQAQSRL